MVLKFKDIFTKKFYPWNLIILVLLLLLIAILTWGGVTDWKFIQSEPKPVTYSPTPKPFTPSSSIPLPPSPIT